MQLKKGKFITDVEFNSYIRERINEISLKVRNYLIDNDITAYEMAKEIGISCRVVYSVINKTQVSHKSILMIERYMEQRL